MNRWCNSKLVQRIALGTLAVVALTGATPPRADKGLETALQRAQVPFTSAVSTQGRGALFASGDTVKLVSMHSSKGLEFPLVVIPGIGQLPNPQVEPAEDARLLYVAMTRALDRLILLSSQPSDFSQRIATAIAQAKDALVGMA